MAFLLYVCSCVNEDQFTMATQRGPLLCMQCYSNRIIGDIYPLIYHYRMPRDIAIKIGFTILESPKNDGI